MIGNADAVVELIGAFAIGARDSRRELGGFALAALDCALAACLDRSIDYLTDSGRIGYELWRADPAVFLHRAEKAMEQIGDDASRSRASAFIRLESAITSLPRRTTYPFQGAPEMELLVGDIAEHGPVSAPRDFGL